MQTKNFEKRPLIIEADDFGISSSANLAVLKAYNEGLLTSTCVMANADAFEEAMEDILPQCKDIGFGVHLNIIEGKSTLEAPSDLLCDANGYYNNGYGALILKSYNKKFIEEVEKEFRFQIERILQYRRVDHINSHVHTHAIPEIFKLTCRLAQEYRIKYVRTQAEIPYLVPDAKKYISSKYLPNLIKNGLLNLFTIKNKQTLKKYNLCTNDFFIGVNYTGYMDAQTIEHGLEAVKNQKGTVEVLIHPNLDETNKPLNYGEYLAITDKNLKRAIKEQKWMLCNYSTLEEGDTLRV